jgi:dolichol kinase
VSLFIASPLIAPLAMLGWGASLGGLVGAAVGAESRAGNKKEKTGTFSALIRDAILSGQVVLVAETRTELETAGARQVMKASVGACEDVSAV